MDTLQIKGNFHTLIDRIDNAKLLSKFYSILEQANNNLEGQLWNKLTLKEQNKLVEIDKETDNEENLIDHSVILEKYNKWL